MKDSVSAGITLLELLVSLVILGILTLLAAPSFSGLVAERQALAAIRSLNQGFSIARSEAVKRRATVTICALGDSMSCSPDWSRDIAIFEDANGDRAVAPGDEIIFTVKAPDSGQFLDLVSNRDYFQYGATGHARNTMGSVVFCPTSPPGDDQYLKLVVHLAGRTRIDRVAGNGMCSH